MANPIDNDDREIILSDDQGNEEAYRVLFTFDAEDYGKSYVLMYRASDETEDEIEIQAFSYTPDENGDVTSGDLEPIQDEAEWDMVQEVLNTFSADDQPDEQ
ncbi:MAG: DUF1292 domain-containing protein [Lactobacillus sp.]|uniref:UPF0473 protein DS831_00165 n=1 Tax=Bombilactobacillus bombi TaxID=1303590 RepID=A0A347SQ99_9LACO|nr:DUF1292 domain-containing protein [Bombilactobacillus bombi]MCO6541442.1 DUF1292 domain-containing protein [Lactobacillus sp.]AXX64208.1 DUF1292 domain-containing protein [Bombilactobacillus bombi]MCO6543574.1 DUF1292 domain-containing protein [Lactobacillus sp.]RHW44159.1 hypothetical protein DS832_09325 [Bombilactobacillus bombi]RHW51788.1 hypothetical protein DS831_00165 [Bombilactobacillus bombi]